MCFKAGFSIKKAIALSFLLLANTVILVHAIICHHHHDTIPVTLVAGHHKHDCNSYNHHHHDAQSVDRCNNYPNCHERIEECSLVTIYVRLNDDKQVSQLLNFDFDQLPYILVPFSDYSIPQIYNDAGLPFRQKPYLLSYHTEYISQSLGLRAPPF